MPSKKEKRSEAKKRKLEALINLMGEDEQQAKKFRNSADKEKDKSFCENGELTSNGETLEEIRKRLRERQKASMQKAKIFLDSKYEEPPLNAIFPMDIQHLLLYAVMGNVASYKPRWCKLIRQVRLSGVVVVIVDSASSVDVIQHQKAFRFLTENFPLRIEVINPSQYGRTLDEELFAVPMSARKVTLSTRSADCNSIDKGTVRDFRFTAQNLDSVKSSVTNALEESLLTRSVSCLDLMLSEEQLKLEGYPLPLVNSPLYSKYKFSKTAYSHPSEKSPLFAVDCEMVRTKANNKELVWIAVVNESLECVYESFVKPRAAVVDYLTEFSGVTKKLLENVTTSLRDVQKKLRSILPSDAILVGQSLGNDLQSLEMFHPYIIDTSVIYNLSGIPLKKTGLKRLSSEFLGRDIQMGKAGHNPREDAIATMELVLKKLKHGLEYGNVLNGWIYGSEKDPSKPIDDQSDKEMLRAEDQSSGDRESGKVEDGMLQRKFFFQQTRTSNCQSLFKLAKRSEKSVALAGFETRWAEEAEILGDKDESDRMIAKQTYLSKANHFCVFSQLNGFGRELRQLRNCNNCLVRSMEDVVKQVKRIVRRLPENNLVVVVLSGRSDANSTQNGLCFLKIL